MADLIRGQDQATALLKGHLQPVLPLEPGRIDQLLGQLDDPAFKVRDHATAALAQLDARIAETTARSAG